MPLAVQLHGDFKEVDLGFVTHAMNQRYIDFCPLAPSLAQVLVNRGQANLITFFQQSAMQPHSSQPLLSGRPGFPSATTSSSRGCTRTQTGRPRRR